jgi:DNA-binding response OmpR family regulator
MTKILVVDDEQDLCEILSFNLRNEGFVVSTANSAEEALALLESEVDSGTALILLDVMMERMSGYEMAHHLRQQGNNTPIIFLTARDAHDDQLTGFANGADDYITKPFSFDTVLARIRAVLKRTQQNHNSGNTFGSLTIDMTNANVSLGGKNVELTRREYMILCLLAQHPDTYFTREEIMTQVWPNDTLVNDRSVDVHIARLRKKLDKEGWRLANRTGFGYIFLSSN